MINLPWFRKKTPQIKPIILVVIDGFGIAPPSQGNAISLAKTPNYTSYLANFPHTELITSGESVGLPANEVGNTEVGHLTLGAGRVILQYLKRINQAIEKATFFDNRALVAASSHVKRHESKFHIIGLVGSGNIHSSLGHLHALLQFCKKEQVKNVLLHIITDGRDAPPNEGVEVVEKLEKHLELIQVGKIASVCGRYYAMDRDRRWERTQKAYNAIVLGRGAIATSAREAVEHSYAKGYTDEFVEPTVITKDAKPRGTIDDNDAAVFFNYRVDRPRQLTMALVVPDFEKLTSFDFGYDVERSREVGKVNLGRTFQREKIVKNLFFVTMTEHHKLLPVSAVAFPPEIVENALPAMISAAGLRQCHLAESEKERFVTYYFDGLREEPLPAEKAVIVPSPKVPTYDMQPEMSLPHLVPAFKRELDRDLYHFFVINFANPDMVAHTGRLPETVRAIEFVDKYLADLVSAVLEIDGTVVVTADHGNAEELVTLPTATFFYTTARGSVNTNHSNNPVPILFINNRWKGIKKELHKGSLADVAPTILTLCNIPIPTEMDGKNLFV